MAPILDRIALAFMLFSGAALVASVCYPTYRFEAVVPAGFFAVCGLAIFAISITIGDRPEGRERE